VRARVFWLISRTAIFLYRHFPLFGPVPGSIAIIRRDRGFLVLQRNDGYGLGFLGGIALPWETAEQALRREVREETGLEVQSTELKFQFYNSILYPTSTTVFEATLADGPCRTSWEGTTKIVSFEDLHRNIMPTQRPVIDYLRAGFDSKAGPAVI
jgi:8-oxo-dGTP pyrophosphatase MutT (NUDIX family)